LPAALCARQGILENVDRLCVLHLMQCIDVANLGAHLLHDRNLIFAFLAMQQRKHQS